MRFASLGSGSAGNSLVVEASSTAAAPTRILLDCGFAVREMLMRLQRLGLEPAHISGILVTHEHDDHAKGAFKFAAKYNIPIWLTYGTFKMCERYLPANMSTHLQINIIDSHQTFALNALQITPYPVPHDAREPTQFTFNDGQHKLGVLTDAGSSTPYIEAVLSACDALVLECNHDIEMLDNGPYAWSLKKRVASRLGHLDNASSAHLLSQLDNTKLQHIIAAHLSAKNNAPALAQQALSQVLNCALDWVSIADQQIGFDWRSFS